MRTLPTRQGRQPARRGASRLETVRGGSRSRCAVRHVHAHLACTGLDPRRQAAGLQRDAFAALGTTRVDDPAATLALHAHEESMRACTTGLRRLVGAFHVYASKLWYSPHGTPCGSTMIPLDHGLGWGGCHRHLACTRLAKHMRRKLPIAVSHFAGHRSGWGRLQHPAVTRCARLERQATADSPQVHKHPGCSAWHALYPIIPNHSQSFARCPRFTRTSSRESLPLHQKVPCGSILGDSDVTASPAFESKR